MSVPPLKSMPKFRPTVRRSSATVRTDRQRREREAHAPEAHEAELGVVGPDAKEAHGLALPSERQRFRPRPAVPQRDHHARHGHGGDDGGQDAEDERRRRSPAPGPMPRKNRIDGGDRTWSTFGVDDGREGAVEARLDARRSSSARHAPPRGCARRSARWSRPPCRWSARCRRCRASVSVAPSSDISAKIRITWTSSAMLAKKPNRP